MKLIVITLVAIALTSCGAETASTAVAVATMKKKEIEQGKATINTVQQKIGQAMEQMQQNESRAAGAEQ
ncbi:conserved exported hypothetical protein [Gammaproteobacteria bacterium]